MASWGSSYKKKSYAWKHLKRYERKRWHRKNAAACGTLDKNSITWKDL